MAHYSVADNNTMICELLDDPRNKALIAEFLSLSFPEELTKIMRGTPNFFGGLDRLALRTLQTGLKTIEKSHHFNDDVKAHAADALETSGLGRYGERDFSPKTPSWLSTYHRRY